MAIMYELLDTSTGNLVAIFETEQEALASVRRTIVLQGRAAVRTLALGTVDEAGDGDQLVAGDTLIARAYAQVLQR